MLIPSHRLSVTVLLKNFGSSNDVTVGACILYLLLLLGVAFDVSDDLFCILCVRLTPYLIFCERVR